MEGLIERIIRESGVPELMQLLGEKLEPVDLQSLLLEVYRRAAGKITPVQLLEHYANNRFVAPSVVDPRQLGDFETLAWELLPPQYQPLELSPLCPLGTTSVVACIDQDTVVSTIRNTEVVADSSNVLGLEAALRRRKQLCSAEHSHDAVLLAASHRLTRAPVVNGPTEASHFRMLSLCAAGRDEGTFDFECSRLFELLAYFLRLLKELAGDGGPWVRFRVAITEMAQGIRQDMLEEKVMAPLRLRFAQSRLEFDPLRDSGRGYYRDVCFKIYASDAGGTEMEFGGGGMTDWTQQLLGDCNERLLIGALGVDRLIG